MQHVLGTGICVYGAGVSWDESMCVFGVVWCACVYSMLCVYTLTVNQV